MFLLSRRPSWCAAPRASARACLRWCLACLLAGLLLQAGPAQAAAAPGGPPPVLQLGPGQAFEALDLVPYAGVLRDDTQSWQIEDAQQRADQFRVEAGVVSDGYHAHRDHWFRLRLRSVSADDLIWWLRVDRAYLDQVRLWHVGPGGLLRGPMRQAGDMVVHLGAEAAPAPTFEIDLTEPGEHEIYLQVRTQSTAWIGLHLIDSAQGLQRAVRELLPVTLLVGASGTIFLLAVVAALWLRERLYLVYAAFVLANTLVWACISGLAHLVVFRLEPPWADRLTASAIAVSAALGPWLYLQLLGLGARAGWLRRAVNSLLLPLLGIAAVAPWFGTNSRLTPYVLWVLVLLQAWVAAEVLRQIRHGAWAERLFSLVVVLMSLLSEINALSALAVIPPIPALEKAGPLAHALNLALLAPYLLRQTWLARRAAQSAEQRAAAAELQNRLRREDLEDKSSLVAMLAHEIRTPLAVIDASMQSLALLDEAVTPERAKRHLRIGRALERLGHLVEMVVTRNRLDVSQWTQQLAPLDLAALTRATVLDLGDEAVARIDVHAEAGLAPLIGDERMLGYALQNLLDNALKYAPTLTPVQVRILSATGRDDRAGLRWSVHDQGPGIRASDAEKVFQKYFRAGDAAEVPGLGLGLYLVRQIIERHGGRVWVEAAGAGAGCCLACWLPLGGAPEDKT